MKQLVSFGKIAACAAMVLGFFAVGSAADWTYNGTDKGWLIHRASKWDPTGMMLLFR